MSRNIKNTNSLDIPGSSKGYLWPALAGLISFVLICIVFAYSGVYPFGDRQILESDAWHQYYPFLVDLQTKLKSGDSLFYTWNNGLGTNFLALSAYYCASPLNLLALVIPTSAFRASYAYIVAAKIAAAGLFCAAALKGAFRRGDVSVTAFGCCYALCAFFLGYFWNIMWLDTVALLPLVFLGTLSIVREGRYRLYIISLALAVICNFHMGLYVCVFTFFAFFLLCICCKLSLPLFGKRFLQIAGCTLLALSLTAFLMLPAYMALMNASFTADTFPSTVKLSESFIDILGNLAAYVDPTVLRGLPNLYCGLPCVLLGALFLSSPEIPRRQRLCALFMLALLVVSMNVNALEFIWNGFRTNNALPYRFSFLVSFVLILMAFRAAPEVFTMTRRKLLLLLAVSIAMLGLCLYTQDTETTIANAVVLAAYLGVLAVYQVKHFSRKLLAALLCVIMGVEILSSAALGVKTISLPSYNNYPKNLEEITELLDTIERQDDSFYRVECVPRQALNDPSLVGYRGLSTFSSVANANVSRLLEKMGIAASAGSNRYFNTYISTPLNNALFGLKYFIMKDRLPEDSVYLEELAASGDVTAYRNNAALPVGFMAEPEMAGEIPDDANPFLRQNAIFSAATGSGEDMFDLVDIIHVGHKNLHVTRSGLGRYTYNLTDETEDGHMKYNYEMPRSGLLYGYVDCDNTKKLTVQCGESSSDYTLDSRSYILCAGYFEKGDLVSFRWDISQEADADEKANIFVAMLDEAAFEEGLAALADETLEVESFSSTSISSTVDVKEAGYFYTSIPYEAGWTLYVDGRETEITPYQDAFIAVENLAPGRHTIELEFVPAGFEVGAAVSLAGLLVFGVVLVVSRRRKKREAA